MGGPPHHRSASPGELPFSYRTLFSMPYTPRALGLQTYGVKVGHRKFSRMLTGPISGATGYQGCILRPVTREVLGELLATNGFLWLPPERMSSEMGGLTHLLIASPSHLPVTTLVGSVTVSRTYRAFLRSFTLSLTLTLGGS